MKVGLEKEDALFFCMLYMKVTRPSPTPPSPVPPGISRDLGVRRGLLAVALHRICNTPEVSCSIFHG